MQYFSVDTTPPAIRVISPENKSYPAGDIDYNLSAEESLSKVVVSIDSGKNITLGKLNQTYFYNLSNWHKNLSEGYHNATFYALDLYGNLNTSTVYFTVDTTPPEIEFIDPSPQPYYNSTTDSITINVSHTEFNPDTLIISWNGTNYSQPYSDSYTNRTLNNLTEGRYTYYVWVNDTAGNWNMTEIRVVTVDRSPPAITSITPANGSGVKGTVTISITAEDKGTGVASVEARIFNTSYSETLILSYNGSGVWYNSSWNTSVLSSGLYNITVNVTDFAGLSNVRETTVIVDNIPPMSEILVPLNGENISSVSYIIEGNASDEGSGLSRIWISFDNGLNWNITTGKTNWSYIWNISSDGTYTIISKAEDNAGNNQSSLTNITVEVDATPPVIAFYEPTPSNGSILSSDKKSITINISISESHPDTLILNWNGANETYNLSSGYWNITKSVSSGNSYTFYIWAKDTFGNSYQSSSISFSVKSVTVQTISSGGGGGGSTPAGYEKNMEELEKGISIDIPIDPEKTGGITSISIKPLTTLYNTKIKIEELKKKPNYIKAPEEKTYRFFRISFSTQAIEKAEVEFRVETSWLKLHNINPHKVSLLRYNKLKWESLPTTFKGRVENYTLYEATSPGFSYFAIVGQENSGFTTEEMSNRSEPVIQPTNLSGKEEIEIKISKETVPENEKEEVVRKLNNKTAIKTVPFQEKKPLCGPAILLLPTSFLLFLRRTRN